MAQMTTVNEFGQCSSSIKWLVGKHLLYNMWNGKKIHSKIFNIDKAACILFICPDYRKDFFRLWFYSTLKDDSESSFVPHINLYSCFVYLSENTKVRLTVAKNESVKKLLKPMEVVVTIGSFNMQSLLNDKQSTNDSSLIVSLKFHSNIVGQVDSDLPPKHESTLVQNLENLFLNERETDILIKVKGSLFKSHRSILAARSEVFAAMLQQDMCEKRSGEIEINDCDPDCFRIFLRYLYTEKTDLITADNAIGVYYIAHKYLFEELKFFCTRNLIHNFRTDLICDILVLASTYDELELLEAATNFFCQNTTEIFLTSQWMDLLKKNPEFSNDLLTKSFDQLKSKPK